MTFPRFFCRLERHHNMEITTLLDIPMTVVAAGICAVWEADQDTPEVYAEQCRINSADLSHSLIGQAPDGQLIGVGILCRRGARGFVLDFGVAPAFRGQGLGQRLFDVLLEQAAQSGVDMLSLIVSGDNQPARRIYTRAGFEIVRKLGVLLGRSSGGVGHDVRPVTDDLPEAMTRWAMRDPHVPPGWERELASLLAMTGVRAFESSRGFLAIRRSVYHRQKEIVQLGLAPDADIDDVRGLLHTAHQMFEPLLPLALPEEPVNSRAYQILETLGFRQVESMYEMAVKL
ncbi:MAG: GNAT family N-acetyltransferase [Anaerolineae bacterium]|nr:GNAT family N-acetyltransferase [Anaerolineae bacterium]